MKTNCIQRYRLPANYYAKLLISALLVVSLSNCGLNGKKDGRSTNQQVDELSSDDFKTELTWLAPWYGEGKKETMMRELGRDFAFLNQDIHLTTMFTNEAYPDDFWWSAVSADIIDMIKTDEWPYDVLICEKGHYSVIANALNDPNWSKKYFVDFGQEDWFVEAHRDGILSSKSISATYGGIIPGPIMEGTIYTLYVSTAVEEKLGLNVKRLDMNFDDFLEYAKVVHNYNQSHPEKIAFFSTQDGTAISRLFKFLLLTGLGKETSSSKYESFKALEQAYTAFETLSKYNPVERYVDYGDLDNNNIQYQLNENDYLFNLEATWIYLIWGNTNPEGIKVMKPCEMPSINGNTATHYEGDFQTIFAVPKRGKNVEEAKKLIRSMTTTDIGEKWIKYSKCPTGLKTRISLADFGQEEFDVFFRHMQEKYGIQFKETDLNYLLWGKSSANTNDEAALNAEYMYQDVINGKLSAKKALERMRQRYE